MLQLYSVTPSILRFSQRTLTTRFEMNLTGTVEVVRKPAINTMVMLSLLGDTRRTVSWAGPGVVSAAVQVRTARAVGLS